MRVLTISNPNSVHTKKWIEGLKEKGLDVLLIYVDKWFQVSKRKPGNLGVKTIILKDPTITQIITELPKPHQFSNVIKDLKGATLLHQKLPILGRQVKEISEKNEVDIIHGHGMAAAGLLAWASNFHPYSVSVWGSDLYLAPKKYPYVRSLIQKSFEGADFIQVHSELAAERVRELAQVQPDKLMISTWGVDTEYFTPRKSNPEVFTKFRIPTKRYLLSFRSLEKLYQIDKIIQAFGRIYHDFPDTSLLISNEGKEKPKCIELAKELGIKDRVIFPGFIEYDSDDRPAMIASAYCVVQCPMSDGVSISALESLASGQPIISSDAGENRIIIKDGKNGFLVNPPYEKNLADAIRELLSNPDLRTQMAHAARESAVKYYNQSKFFEEYITRAKMSRN